MRVAIYVRVSTEEQARYGFSIQAQKDSLLDYAKAHDYRVVDIYSDEGVSGGRIDRPELNRLLDDVRSDKIDMILFIKLDRWFRSVAHYYKIQEILEEHHVVWRTTEEEYETETSSGRFKVNIMLSVSQQMKDATSERIKFVFENKIKQGSPLNGNQPLGYKIETIDGRKRVVKDETKSEMVLDIFDFFETHQSLTKTAIYFYSKYGIQKRPQLVRDMITNPIYYGSKRGFDNYCEPYLSRERWEHIQSLLQHRNFKMNKSHDYLFAGLLKCSECGRNLSGKFCRRSSGKDTYYYRCLYYYTNRTCGQQHMIQESILEPDVIKKINEAIADYSSSLKFTAVSESEAIKTDQKKIDLLKLEKDNVTKSFIKGWISEADADIEHARIDSEIKKLTNKKTKIKKVETLDRDWVKIYNSLTRNGKALFLRSIIDSIVIDSEKYLLRDPDYLTINFL